MSAPTITQHVETPPAPYEPRQPPATNPILGAWDELTWRSAGYLMLGLFTGVLGLATFIVVVVVGATFSALIIGVPVLLACLAVSRGFAEIERRRAGIILGTAVPVPYPLVSGGYLRRIGQWLAAPSTWRDLAHHLFVFPVTLFSAIVALTFWGAALGSMSFWAWYWSMPNDTIYVFGDWNDNPFAVDSFASAMPWVGVGLVLLWVSGWVTKGLARMSAAYTEFLLGPSQSGR
ncbi:sensor domain-containing protein [Cryptosporangium aurantiacum]|uniref:Putative sensor n=1 Tax=Cryptosporangium aurantiacum TaxID=134849 RepID=A0A1M7RGY9_9ACTN|nr:sensor domain-containing protein [Cryptosporangium aurantiacum]SHN45517.1 Putative sensor [Cryptosporangium aurantiacum]